MIRFLTSGESHGKAITLILEGMPAQMDVDFALLETDLNRRKTGYGRSSRMKIETDEIVILSGIRNGKTLGSPISLMIENKDYENHHDNMPVKPVEKKIEPVSVPRPGHADLNGAMKYRFHDIRNVIERSSARETAMRTAAGAFAKMLLQQAGISIGSYVESIGGILPSLDVYTKMCNAGLDEREINALKGIADKSSIRVLEDDQEENIIKAIDNASSKGDSLGGSIITFAAGLPVGLGSYAHYDRRIDAAFTAAIMSIHGIKGLEIGAARRASFSKGSDNVDSIYYQDGRPRRRNNKAGGIEGGMTNGMPLLIRSYMKPIPTMKTPVESIHLANKEESDSRYERSDITAVPACSVITEAMTALTAANFFLEKYGGDSMEELLEHYRVSRTAEEKLFHT